MIATVSAASFALAPLFYEHAFAQDSTAPIDQQNISFEPVVSKPAWVDTDDNGIADTLDQEIHERQANGTTDEWVNVTVTLKAPPLIEDANDFVTCGGYLTSEAWTEATYGFGGMTTYAGVAVFAQTCSNLLLVEKEAMGKAAIAYAAQQVGARTYVWNSVGLQGDPNSAIAFLDTGVDGSHVDFQPGYGNLDFSKKIVGWNDQIGGSTSPADDSGHGSHVAGLATGDGFFSVDASGNAVATWGADLGPVSASGTYAISGIPVNKPGNINIAVKWGHTGSGSTLTALALAYGGKTLKPGTQIASVSTPNQNTFYSLNYTVTSAPTTGFDMYHIGLTVASGSRSSDLYVTFTLSWPYTPPSDGFQAWTGIAPQSKVVGIKIMNSLGSGTANQLISGINWLITNRQNCHVTVASMSLGFATDQSSVDSSVVNLVNSGVAVVVAAGNDGSGSNRIYTCGSIDEVVTVAAMNQFDAVTDYSSQGGPSRATRGTTVKPDITAPGGSLDGLPLFSVDSNYNDAEGRFTETQPNDAAPLQGTSMATPIVSGCAQLLIQAMGGFASWNYTRAQALQPKMILCMTATETYPNLREGNTSAASPTLDRGGKDVHEGYGRVNLDAAVDAVMKSYGVGSVATDSLGVPPTVTDTSVLGQHLAWARNVQLISGTVYNFSLNVPAGADFDLYLYNSVGTTYGEPAIVARSINATTGGTEQFFVKAPYTGTYYIVVKRATETTGSGTFTLASSGPSNVLTVILNTPGLQTADNVVHYTQSGAPINGSINSGTFSGIVDPSTTVTIDNPIYASATQRYVTSDPTSFTVQTSSTYTVNYKTQFYITVNSSHDAPTGSNWVDQGGTLAVSVTSPSEIVPTDHQWVCTGYSIDGGTPQAGTSYTFNAVVAAHTVVFNWKEQFYLSVNSSYGSVSGEGFYDSGSTATATIAAATVSGGSGVQYVFTGWSGGASGTSSSSNPIVMNGPNTAVANWKTQYYLNVDSAYGSTGGAGWYDSGATATAALSSGTVAADQGIQHVFIDWSGDAVGSSFSTSDAIVMNTPKTATANWKTQYYLTTSTNFGTVSPDSGWYDAGSSAAISTTAPSVASGERYEWGNWTGTGSSSYTGTETQIMFKMNSPVNETAFWSHQFLLIVTSPYGSPTPTSGWFEAGTSVQSSVNSPVNDNIVTQRLCSGWSGTGSVPVSGSVASTTFTLTQPSSITWKWETQYLLVPIAEIIGIPMVLIIVAIALILRRRKNTTNSQPMPEPSSTPS